ncbi:MAG: hypothetical protein K1X31_07080 [Gemmatimonadaceae bacterium]|nr:hypothetical protein [Gemmatimonadaceae bacterium]
MPSAPSARSATDGRPADGPAIGETCDYCGATALQWRKCKLICENCRQINKSCADL